MTFCVAARPFWYGLLPEPSSAEADPVEMKIRALDAYCGVARTVTSVRECQRGHDAADDHDPATTENAQIVAKLHNDPLVRGRVPGGTIPQA